MVTLFLFIFGLSVGSFISCWVWRINNQNPSTSEEFPRLRSGQAWLSRLPATIRGVLTSRSVCDYCQKQLTWYDNLPLVSFLLLRGKSRCCRSPIPLQYFLVELSAAFLTVFVYDILIYHIWSFGLTLLIVYALIAIFVSDLNYQTVPDVIVGPGIIIALVYDLLLSVHLGGVLRTPSEVFLGYLFSGLAAGGLFFLLSRLKIKDRQAMGFGDVEIAFLMGLFLGFPKTIVALYLAFLTGAVFGVILILRGKKNLKSQIAFGPFLAGATIISLFWGEQIIKIFLSSS